MMLQWGDYLPVAMFTYSINDLTVSFNASGSYDRDGKIVSYDWDFGDTNNGTGVIVNHTYSQNGTYEIVLTITDNENKNGTFSEHVFLGYDATPPQINSVSDSPDTVGFGFPVNITANVTDDFSGVKTVKVNVTYPDNSTVNYTMDKITGSIYQCVFSDAWQNGLHYYIVWAVDYANNINGSSQYSFNVSAQAKVSVYPIKDAFGDNEFINITDPPSLEAEEDGLSQPPTKSMDETDNDPMPLGGESSTAEDNVTYYFNDYDTNEAWTINPSWMVDGDTRNSSSTSLDGDVELCDNNTCPGTNLGSISKVEIRVFGFCPIGERDIILRPVLHGRDGNNYTYDASFMPAWSEWFDITTDPCRGNPGMAKWSWSEVQDLDCDVEAEDMFFGPWFVLECSKVEIRVTYTNTPPVASDPVPIHGAIGVILPPILYITVSDVDGQLMNITWYHSSDNGTNSSENCSWIEFGTNTRVGNGVYHQVFSNATQNYTWYYWKVNVTDGKNYFESSAFKFYSGVCQSKINNSGSTNISGYLLIKVHFYNTTLNTWVVDHPMEMARTVFMLPLETRRVMYW